MLVIRLVPIFTGVPSRCESCSERDAVASFVFAGREPARLCEKCIAVIGAVMATWPPFAPAR